MIDAMRKTIIEEVNECEKLAVTLRRTKKNEATQSDGIYAHET